MEKALLVTMILQDKADSWGPEESKRELCDLARSAFLIPICEKVVVRRTPHPRFMIGTGKAQELAEMVKVSGAEVAVFSHDLSASQQRNLEDILQCKTIDRTQLILDIFGRRARSLEGKVQVELAQLSYLLPRLTGRGILLSRLGGGIGTRGPGEQKLEMDRRRIRQRIRHLEGELDKLSRRRQSYRFKRAEDGIPVVAIIGYTNAGKSTLFNAFTKAGVWIQDRLFSTLDPTVRRFLLPNKQKVLFIDTVGFLHHLPHHLIDAFKATLEEVSQADLLIHVVDISRPDAPLLERSVREVLSTLGAAAKKCVTVLNKVDCIADDNALCKMKKTQWPDGLFVSALHHQGFIELTNRIQEEFQSLRCDYEFHIPSDRANFVACVYEAGEVLLREDRESGVYLRARLSPRAAESILKRMGSQG